MFDKNKEKNKKDLTEGMSREEKEIYDGMLSDEGAFDEESSEEGLSDQKPRSRELGRDISEAQKEGAIKDIPQVKMKKTKEEVNKIYNDILNLESSLFTPIKCDVLNEKDLEKLMAIDKRIKYSKTLEEGNLDNKEYKKIVGTLFIPNDQYHSVVKQLDTALADKMDLNPAMNSELAAREVLIKPYLDQLRILEAKAAELYDRAVTSYVGNLVGVDSVKDLEAAQAMLSACVKFRKPFASFVSDKNMTLYHVKNGINSIDLDKENATLSTHRGFKGVLEKIINYLEKLFKESKLTPYSTDSAKKMSDFKQQFKKEIKPDNDPDAEPKPDYRP